MVLIEQISALMDYLENHQDLALGHCSRTSEGRSLSKRLWTECAQILNSIAIDCPTKTPTEWRTFYNEYKSKLLKKIKASKREQSATGGGPAKSIQLTPLQDRLYSLLGRDIGEPLPGVRHNPLTPTIMLPVVEVSPTTVSFPITQHASTSNQLENNSFSLLENFEIPLSVSDVENIESQEISTEQQRTEITSITQPPKQRRRQKSARHAKEDRDHAALEAAQARLDAIEARNAEATLQQAQATNNLAAAINRLSSATEKIVDLIGQLVTPVPQKGTPHSAAPCSHW